MVSVSHIGDVNSQCRPRLDVTSMASNYRTYTIWFPSDTSNSDRLRHKRVNYLKDKLTILYLGAIYIAI